MDNKRGDFWSPLTHFSFNLPQMYNILSVVQDNKKPEGKASGFCCWSTRTRT